jgi:hypothetical protein
MKSEHSRSAASSIAVAVGEAAAERVRHGALGGGQHLDVERDCTWMT